MTTIARRLFDRATDAWAITNMAEKNIAQWSAEGRRTGRPYPRVSHESSTLARRLDAMARELATPEEVAEFAAACEANAVGWESKAPSTHGLHDSKLAYAKTMASHYRGCAETSRERAKVKP